MKKECIQEGCLKILEGWGVKAEKGVKAERGTRGGRGSQRECQVEGEAE